MRSDARTLTEVVQAASGRAERQDPALPGTGGPAGNARLTAWTGLLLIVLLAAEGVTILRIGPLLRWHIVFGVLLIPPALLKTASTGWRIARYYAGSRPYRQAGPPPTLLRLLGPLVVVSTLAVLASGLALIPLGPVGSRSTITVLAGQRVDALTLHQACFLGWLAVTTVHVLARTVPAWRIVSGRTGAGGRVDGASARLVLVLAALVVGAVGAALVLGFAQGWVAVVTRF